MLQNARDPAFTVFELLRENQHWEGWGVKLPPPPPPTQIKVNYNRNNNSNNKKYNFNSSDSRNNINNIKD